MHSILPFVFVAICITSVRAYGPMMMGPMGLGPMGMMRPMGPPMMIGPYGARRLYRRADGGTMANDDLVRALMGEQ